VAAAAEEREQSIEFCIEIALLCRRPLTPKLALLVRVVAARDTGGVVGHSGDYQQRAVAIAAPQLVPLGPSPSNIFDPSQRQFSIRIRGQRQRGTQQDG
jgi:hypothetical protein